MKWLIAIESSNSHLSLFISAKSLLRVKNWLKYIKDLFISKKQPPQYILFSSSLSLPECLYCVIKEDKEQWVFTFGCNFSSVFLYG